MTRPRIEPGDSAQVGRLTWWFSRAAGLVGGTNPPNLFLTLGRHPKLFRGWLRFAGRLMPGGVLVRRETELAILRVAHLRDCRYEFDHHVRLSRRTGVAPAEVQGVEHGPDAVGWSARERAVLRAVDGLHRDLDLDQATWTALREHLAEREPIELVLLVGHYEMLATVIAALRIQPDAARRRG